MPITSKRFPDTREFLCQVVLWILSRASNCLPNSCPDDTNPKKVSSCLCALYREHGFRSLPRDSSRQDEISQSASIQQEESRYHQQPGNGSGNRITECFGHRLWILRDPSIACIVQCPDSHPFLVHLFSHLPEPPFRHIWGINIGSTPKLVEKLFSEQNRCS